MPRRSSRGCACFAMRWGSDEQNPGQSALFRDVSSIESDRRPDRSLARWASLARSQPWHAGRASTWPAFPNMSSSGAWSSHRANALGHDDPLVHPHPNDRVLGTTREGRCAAYRAIAMETLPDDDIEAIRMHLQRQRAPGSDRFRAAIEGQARPRRPAHSRSDGHAGLPPRKVHAAPPFCSTGRIRAVRNRPAHCARRSAGSATAGSSRGYPCCAARCRHGCVPRRS